MSGVLFYLPNARQLSLSGAILPGFKLKFFISGTLTPAAVYEDGDLMVSLGTTVTAESDGHMPAIYLNPAVVYRVQVYDALDVLQPDGDVDPLNTLASESGPIAAEDVTYDNATSGLTATNVQDAIDELEAAIGGDVDGIEWPLNVMASIAVASGTSLTPTPTNAITMANNGTPTAQTVGATPATLLEAINRIRWVSATATNDTAGNHQNGNFSGVFRALSNVPSMAGFQFEILFSWRTVASDQRVSVGLSGSVSADVGQPSANTDCLFFAKDSADTNLQVMHNDGSGTATKVDTGVVFTTLTGKLLRMRVLVTPGDPNPVMTLDNMETGSTIYTHTPSTNLPAADAQLWCRALANTAANTTAVSVEIVRLLYVTRFGCSGV